MIDPATGEHRESNSEMAYKAAKQALDRAGIPPSEVELVVLSTASPDVLLPPIVCERRDFVLEFGLRQVLLDTQGPSGRRVLDIGHISGRATCGQRRRVVLAIDPVRQPAARPQVVAEKRVIPLAFQDRLDWLVADPVDVDDRARASDVRERISNGTL